VMLPATTLKPLPFRFDHDEHKYYDLAGAVLPNITAMLQQTGHVDPQYYTDESRERGRAVHSLTADVDLRAVDPKTLVSKYRGYVLAHVAAMARLKPQMVAIEEPDVHPQYRFGGRPDRVAYVFKVLSVLDEKSGGPEKWHAVQTALQAILKAWRFGLKPESIQRFTLYLDDAGGYKNKLHDKRRDFYEAYDVIRQCCRR
jgi:hypothetical protein